MSDRVPPSPIEVLLVEDDPGDVLMTQEAFKDYKIANTLSVVTNGEDAIAYLRKQGRYADAPTPDLVLLDLNLPRRDGREVLRDVKSDADLRRIPVVVLTAASLDSAERGMLRERVLGLIDKQGLDRAALVREVQRVLSLPEPEAVEGGR